MCLLRERAPRFELRRLELDTALVRAGNPQIFSVLCNGSACDLDACLCQLFGNNVICHRVCWIFFINHLSYQAL
jgi:hypothetical protein